MSGVSVTWYTWLEQGRDVHVSDEVLERISQTFQLTSDERGYLFSLVQHRPPPLQATTEIDVDPVVQRMVDALGVPALAMNARWDVLAWNGLTSAVFRDYGEIEARHRNLLRILFTEPVYASDPDEFESMGQRVAAKLRIDYSEAAPDPAFDELIHELEENSPLFRRIWHQPDVTARSYGINRVEHAKLGTLIFEHSSYVPEGNPLLRIVVFAPHDEATAAVLKRLRD